MQSHDHLKEIAQRFFQLSAREGLYDSDIVSECTIDSIEPGRIVCLLPVSHKLQNRHGTLHGGATATIVDTIGTAALLTQQPDGGVSLNIATTYLHAMPGEGIVKIDAKVAKVGRSIAVIDVQLFDTASGRLVSSGTHIKHVSASNHGSSTGRSMQARSKL